ncbi:MAG: hypothetical protein ACFFDB_15505 [Promethearchaeota archaeon]
MSKFFENLRDKVKNIPNLITKRLVQVLIRDNSLEFGLPLTVQNQSLKQYLEDLIIKVNDNIVYDAELYPFDYDIRLNGIFYSNQQILEIIDKSLNIRDKLKIIVPNREKISSGFHKVIIATHSSGTRAVFDKYFSYVKEKREEPVINITKNQTYKCKNCGKEYLDSNQVICEYCGSDLKD